MCPFGLEHVSDVVIMFLKKSIHPSKHTHKGHNNKTQVEQHESNIEFSKMYKMDFDLPNG